MNKTVNGIFHYNGGIKTKNGTKHSIVPCWIVHMLSWSSFILSGVLFGLNVKQNCVWTFITRGNGLLLPPHAFHLPSPIPLLH